MKTVKFKLTDEEHDVLTRLADDGKHQKQTPDELAYDVVAMFLVSEQASEQAKGAE